MSLYQAIMIFIGVGFFSWAHDLSVPRALGVECDDRTSEFHIRRAKHSNLRSHAEVILKETAELTHFFGT